MIFNIVIFTSIVTLPLIIGIIIIFINSYQSIKKQKIYSSQFHSLLFHSVTDEKRKDQSHISTIKFELILQYLQDKKYKTFTVSDIVQYRKKMDISTNIVTNKSPIALCFDDGFENYYFHAFPLLNRYGCTSTVFPVAKSIDTYADWDVYSPEKHLSRSQIIRIAEAGHEIGSHTLSHPDLALLSHNDILFELTESKHLLEDIIGKKVTALSFPFGSWNKRVWKLAQEAGYETGVVYRKHYFMNPSILPVTGVYAFDSIDDIIEKIEFNQIFNPIHSRDYIMPHFAKGTPMWKFRKSYRVEQFWLHH